MTDRQTKILEIVNQKKKVEVATLSKMLEVSQVTIRKDLDALEELNFLTREHGYATMKNMSDISNRMAFCYETKQRIAAKASEIVSDGETIMVESGSSCALLVKQLSETKKDITVITNSSYIARFIRESRGWSYKGYCSWRRIPERSRSYGWTISKNLCRSFLCR